MADFTPELVGLIRIYLESHKIRLDVDGLPYRTEIGLEKCDGCPWIGWSHVHHQAETVGAAVAAVTDTAADEFFRSTP